MNCDTIRKHDSTYSNICFGSKESPTISMELEHPVNPLHQVFSAHFPVLALQGTYLSKLWHAKKMFQSGFMSKFSFEEYKTSTLALLALQVQYPQLIDSYKVSRQWEKLAYSLRFENAPKELENRGIDGCGYFHYANALSSFLENRTFMLTSKEDTKTITLFSNEVCGRLQTLLQTLLNVACAVNALKFLPNPQTINLPELCSTLIYDELKGALEEFQEILIPLGWLYPAPFNGHLILCKIRATDLQKKAWYEIKLLDPKRTTGDAVLDQQSGQSSTSLPTYFTFFRNIDKAELLKDILFLLPLQIPENLGYRSQLYKLKNTSQEISTKLFQSALKVNYTVMGRGISGKGELFFNRPEGDAKEDLPDSSKESKKWGLDTMNYMPGKNCVPSAFRMLLYTLAKEECIKAEGNLLREEELKTMCDSFLEEFNTFISSKFISF